METDLTYRIAPMSLDVRLVSAGMLCIPAVFLAVVLAGDYVLCGPLVFVCVIYAWVWLLFRPTAFIIHPEEIEIVWPLKRRTIRRDSITSARIIDVKELKRDIGWGARVGAGGLWGGFGWLWTTKRGIVQMYISRTDRFVWLERGTERPWLVTPERPKEFVRELIPR